MDKQERYTYANAGFDRFFRRSIDSIGAQRRTLAEVARNATQQSRSVNFDQQQISGNMSGVMNIDRITLDGQQGNIRIEDASGEVRAFLGARGE